jgi:hypothetical protein
LKPPPAAAFSNGTTAATTRATNLTARARMNAIMAGVVSRRYGNLAISGRRAARELDDMIHQ